MTTELHFDNLCQSAFDFILRSIDELEKEPKYALVHFAFGLELILKARLFKEHWSLVITSQPSLKALAEGNFHSVGPDEAMKRLETIVGQPITADARRAFESVARHRNKVVHFYHDSLAQHANASMRGDVAIDICRGWFHLQKLIHGWKADFFAYKSDVIRLEVRMKKVRSFLQVVYEARLQHIRDQIAKGIEVTACPSCGFQAALLTSVTSKLFTQRCVVCDLDATLVRYTCANEECGLPMQASGWHGFQIAQCECGTANDQEDLKDALDSSFHDYTNPPEPVGCPQCYGSDTVVEHEHLHVCTECLSYSENVWVCDYCNQGQIGDDAPDDTQLSGCEFCNGAMGNIKDD